MTRITIPNPKSETLAQIVWTQIGKRVMLCITLLFVALIFVTAYDISNQSRDVSLRIEKECQSLESFIVSQFLIDNVQAAYVKIEHFNHKNAMHVQWINEEKSQPKGLIWLPPFNWKYSHPITQIDANLGYLEVTGSLLNDRILISDFIKRLVLLGFISFLILSLLQPLYHKIPNLLFVEPINQILRILDETESEPDRDVQNKWKPREIQAIEAYLLKILRDKQVETRKNTLMEISAQVAHDIRSPLAALNVLIEDLSKLEEEKRILARRAIARINDIANNLLTQHNKERAIADPLSSEMPAMLIDSLISEKRAQYANHQIILLMDASHECYRFFASIHSGEFKRSLSNIIDNSYEAISHQGTIQIHLEIIDKKLKISITDTGCGIPSNILDKITQKGFSSGKKVGNGLGLSYAINKFTSWGCHYTISSEINKGTRIEIIMPEGENASWFLPKITLQQNEYVAILDDDESIHGLWEQRFSALSSLTSPVKLCHFYDSESYVKWLTTENTQHYLHLVDYELYQSNLNGLEIMESYLDKHHAVLVTSRFDNEEIREKCTLLGLKMIPKSYAVHIPIDRVNGY